MCCHIIEHAQVRWISNDLAVTRLTMHHVHEYLQSCFPDLVRTVVPGEQGAGQGAGNDAAFIDHPSGWRVIAGTCHALDKYADGSAHTTWTRHGLDVLWSSMFNRDAVMVVLPSLENETDENAGDGGVMAWYSVTTRRPSGWLPDMTMALKNSGGHVSVQLEGSRGAPSACEWPDVFAVLSACAGCATARRRFAEDCEMVVHFAKRAEDGAADLGITAAMCGSITSFGAQFWTSLETRIAAGMTAHWKQTQELQKAKKRAREVVAGALDANLVNIKARLWRPDGNLMASRFAECDP